MAAAKLSKLSRHHHEMPGTAHHRPGVVGHQLRARGHAVARPFIHDRQAVDHDALGHQPVALGLGRRAVIVHTIARYVDHAPGAFIGRHRQYRAAELQRPGQARARQAAPRLGVQRRRPGRCVRTARNPHPGQQQLLPVIRGPLDIRDADRPDGAALDGGQHLRVGQPRPVAVPLQRRVAFADGAADINGQHQQQVHRRKPPGQPPAAQPRTPRWCGGFSMAEPSLTPGATNSIFPLPRRGCSSVGRAPRSQ